MVSLKSAMAKPFKLEGSLSVVIPAYNEEGNIARVVAETIRDAKKIAVDFEIVVVNDGSSDKTGVVIDSLAEKYKEVKALHHKGNKGLALAWRTGVDAAKK